MKEHAVDKVNEERLELLAQKYAGDHFPREMEARLRIDHHKMELECPRVTQDDFDAVAETRRKFKESGEEMIAMLEELGVR